MSEVKSRMFTFIFSFPQMNIVCTETGDSYALFTTILSLSILQKAMCNACNKYLN
jgi:hypothetical protein